MKNTQQYCLICERIKEIKQHQNPYFVKELDTGYVVIGDHQFFRGYTLFLCKEHKQELHELTPDFRKQYLWEMSLVAKAVFYAFKPQKLNYELLGNTDSHLHWHIFPRHANDPLPNRTIWNIDQAVRNAESVKPDESTLTDLKTDLKKSLDRIRKKPALKREPALQLKVLSS